MTDKEREAFWRLAKSGPSGEEMRRQYAERLSRGVANSQQPSEHPIDGMIRCFLEREGNSHEGVFVRCPVCGNETCNILGKCEKCNTPINNQMVKGMCSCCGERLATKIRKVRIVKVKSCCGGLLSYYERYIKIPICAKCNLHSHIPFLGKKTLGKNQLVNYLFSCGCGLSEMSSDVPL